MKTDPVIRFWAKVDRSGGPEACWPWMGHRNRAGYGSFAMESGRHGHHMPTGAHRAAVILTSGPLGPGDVVRHRCDNPPCVNPAHLLRGTAAENTRDMLERGRGLIGTASPRAKLTETAVRAIRAEPDVPATELAARFGVSRALIHKIRAGQSWKRVA